MSEEKLYIDDGELIYYINENEFIACDEIPMPMLEGIKDLQQKVEQLENIRKEAIEYTDNLIIFDGHNYGLYDCYINVKNDLLNILNKGSEE